MSANPTVPRETRLTRLTVRNYKSLASVDLELRPLMVFFGPNGAGKSNLIEAVTLVAHLSRHDFNEVIRERSLADDTVTAGTKSGTQAEIGLARGLDYYQIQFHKRLVGEYIETSEHWSIHRPAGQNRYQVTSSETNTTESLVQTKQTSSYFENHPDRYLDGGDFASFLAVLRTAQGYDTRQFDYSRLRQTGSPWTTDDTLGWNAVELWTVLRALHDSRDVDNRFETIIHYMAEAFPLFKTILPKSVTPETTYAEFIETVPGRRFYVTQMPHGYLQLLIILTILFGQLPDEISRVIVLDEPDLSLHPWAQHILSKAVLESVEKWNRQVFIATHSPVLLSQFESEVLYTVEPDQQGHSKVTCVAEIGSVQELLHEYAAGSLYMTGMLAPQDVIPAPYKQ